MNSIAVMRSIGNAIGPIVISSWVAVIALGVGEINAADAGNADRQTSIRGSGEGADAPSFSEEAEKRAEYVENEQFPVGEGLMRTARGRAFMADMRETVMPHTKNVALKIGAMRDEASALSAMLEKPDPQHLVSWWEGLASHAAKLGAAASSAIEAEMVYAGKFREVMTNHGAEIDKGWEQRQVMLLGYMVAAQAVAEAVEAHDKAMRDGGDTTVTEAAMNRAFEQFGSADAQITETTAAHQAKAEAHLEELKGKEASAVKKADPPAVKKLPQTGAELFADAPKDEPVERPWTAASKVTPADVQRFRDAVEKRIEYVANRQITVAGRSAQSAPGMSLDDDLKKTVSPYSRSFTGKLLALTEERMAFSEIAEKPDPQHYVSWWEGFARQAAKLGAAASNAIEAQLAYNATYREVMRRHEAGIEKEWENTQKTWLGYLIVAEAVAEAAANNDKALRDGTDTTKTEAALTVAFDELGNHDRRLKEMSRVNRAKDVADRKRMEEEAPFEKVSPLTDPNLFKSKLREK